MPNTNRDNAEQITQENIAAFDAACVRMLANRKGEIDPLPLLYRELVQSTSGPVLSLCSGLGLCAIQFARAGFEVTCVDLSELMLAYTNQLLAEESDDTRDRIELRCTDVRIPAGHKEFGLIVLDDWDFAQLLTQDDQLACLSAIREALRPDGRAVIDVFSPYYKMHRDHTLTGEPFAIEITTPEGRLNRRTTISEFDQLTQIETMYVLFEEFDGIKKTFEHRCVWKLRHTGLWEFELLLKMSGLCPVLRCPDFAFDRPLAEQPPFDHATDDFAYVLSRG